MMSYTLLLTGPCIGIAGPNEEFFEDSTAHYERVEVVRVDDLLSRVEYARETLAHALENLPGPQGTNMPPEAELLLEHFTALCEAVTTRESCQD